MNTTTSQDAALIGVLGALPEKFVVDFANGIDVTGDHIATQRQRSGMFDRLCDGFSGNAQRRQTEINASLADGVAGSLIWLTDLTGSLAKSNLAIGKVKERVVMLQETLTGVTLAVGDIQQELRHLEQALTRRVAGFAMELMRIDLVQRAKLHLDFVFSKWEAGVFAHLSPAGRCYATLEELRWGEFGDFYRNTAVPERAMHMGLLRHRALTQLAADAGVAGNARMNTTQWIAVDHSASGQTMDLQDGLAYLGDWASAEQAPFVFAVANTQATLPMLLPRRCSAERVVAALVAEVFDGATA